MLWTAPPLTCLGRHMKGPSASVYTSFRSRICTCAALSEEEGRGGPPHGTLSVVAGFVHRKFERRIGACETGPTMLTSWW